MKGNIQRANGETLRGTFKDGLLHGQGSCESKSKRSIHHGSFIDGEKHEMGQEVFYKKSNDVLSKYTGYFCNNERSGVGTMELQDAGFTFDCRKGNLRLDGPWLGGEPKAGGMITNLQFASSMPTTNKPSSQYKLLNRFKRIEEHKDLLENRELVNSERMNVDFRSFVESKKKQMFDMHRKNVKQALSEQRSEKVQLERERKLPPKSINSRGLQREIVESVEKSWLEMGLDFEESTDMRCVRTEFDLLQEKWDVMNLDKIRARVSDLVEEVSL